jgi:hypothetical protein
MSSPIRLLGITLLAALYWVIAGTLIFLLAYGIPGDCGLEKTQEGVSDCIREGQLVFLIGIVAALAIYSVVLWKVARRQ